MSGITLLSLDLVSSDINRILHKLKQEVNSDSLRSFSNKKPICGSFSTIELNTFLFISTAQDIKNVTLPKLILRCKSKRFKNCITFADTLQITFKKCCQLNFLAFLAG